MLYSSIRDSLLCFHYNPARTGLQEEAQTLSALLTDSSEWCILIHMIYKGEPNMKRIVTVKTRDLKQSVKTGGCGECQTSCQSACKTSCGVANQNCEKKSK